MDNKDVLPAGKSHELHHFPISPVRVGGPIPFSEDSRMMEDTTDMSPPKTNLEPHNGVLDSFGR